MNVLSLCESFWPEGRGGELATYLYVKLLKQNGVDVKVVTGTHFGVNKYINALMALDFLKKRFFKRLIMWADVVYMPNWYSAIPLIKKLYRKPIVIHFHSYFPLCPLGSLYDLCRDSLCNPKRTAYDHFKCILRYERTHERTLLQTLVSGLLNSTVGKKYTDLINLSDAIIFVSKAQRDLVLKSFPEIRSKSHVIYNPLPELSYIPIEGDDLGYFGGPSPLKGFHVLMRAWPKICCTHNVKIHATKMNRFHDSELLRKDKVVPYGKLDEQAYENVYRRVRGIILPSIWPEPLPYVVTEALLRGRIIIASQVGGVPEIVDRLRGAFLVSPNDADDLANAIEKLFSMDRSDVKKLGLKNREYALGKFDNKRIIHDFINTLYGVRDSCH